MAVPTYLTAGTAVVAATATTVSWPTEGTYTVGDVGVLVVQTSNEAVTTPTGWTAVTNSPQGTGTAATLGSTLIAVFTRIAATTAEADVSIADSGDHQRAQIYVLHGCELGNIINTSAGDVDAVGSTAVTVPGGTTTQPNCLIFVVIGHATTSGNQVSGYANASLTNTAEKVDGGAATGTGGGWSIWTGSKATAGVYSATTATLATSSRQARISIAFQGSQQTPNQPVDPYMQDVTWVELLDLDPMNVG